MTNPPLVASGESYDLIIVGAGPAGLSTALHLARLAPHLLPRTLILEKDRHPRPKLCGGGILPDGERILEALGLDLTEVPHVDVTRAHFDFDGQGFCLHPDPTRPYAFRIIRRHEFDSWLAGKARAAGVTILEETKVLRLTREEEGVVLETTRGNFRARAVVGADGSHGIVRRSIIGREPTHSARLLEVVTPVEERASTHPQNESCFDFFVVPLGIQGYTWDFPALEKGLPVRVRGIFDFNGIRRGNALSLREGLAREFNRHGLELSEHELQGHPIRWFKAQQPVSAPRMLLVGDAAGSDALYGEGISLALGYGALAARILWHAFDRQDFSFRTYRPALLRSQMGRSLRWRTFLAMVFYRLQPVWFQKFAWRRLCWLIRAVMGRFVIGWVGRQQQRDTFNGKRGSSPRS